VPGRSENQERKHPLEYTGQEIADLIH
jgi:hypothetical protein